MSQQLTSFPAIGNLCSNHAHNQKRFSDVARLPSALLALLESGEASCRKEAAFALGSVGRGHTAFREKCAAFPSLPPLLLSLLRSSDEECRRYGAFVIAVLFSNRDSSAPTSTLPASFSSLLPTFVPLLLQIVASDPNRGCRSDSIWALHSLGSSGGWGTIVGQIKTSDDILRKIVESEWEDLQYEEDAAAVVVEVVRKCGDEKGIAWMDRAEFWCPYYMNALESHNPSLVRRVVTLTSNFFCILQKYVFSSSSAPSFSVLDASTLKDPRILHLMLQLRYIQRGEKANLCVRANAENGRSEGVRGKLVEKSEESKEEKEELKKEEENKGKELEGVSGDEEEKKEKHESGNDEQEGEPEEEE